MFIIIQKRNFDDMVAYLRHGCRESIHTHTKGAAEENLDVVQAKLNIVSGNHLPQIIVLVLALAVCKASVRYTGNR